MKVTILWEDQRSAIVKTFGPHELLLACVADDLGQGRDRFSSRVIAVPKKGNGNVLRAIESDLVRLREAGPVCAVFDRDEIRNLIGQGPAPECISGIKHRMAKRAPGNYELLLLDRNTETLVTACCRAQQQPAPVSKPTPDQRDRILGRTVWATGGERAAVRNIVPSFDRLVRWVVRQLADAPQVARVDLDSIP